MNNSKYKSRYFSRFDSISYQKRVYLRKYSRQTSCTTLGIMSFYSNIKKYSTKCYKYVQGILQTKNTTEMCTPDNTCSICLSPLQDNDKNTKWLCTHRFHSHCIESWNTSCPLCRCELKLITSKCYEYKDDERWSIEFYLRVSTLVPIKESVKYKSLWKHPTCISENHEITFHNTHHLAGICHNCSILDNSFGIIKTNT